MQPLSGNQIRLGAGDYSTTIASVGASLRELTWQGRHLVVPLTQPRYGPSTAVPCLLLGRTG